MPDRYAVIGNPVAHSRSPWIHAQFAQATRQDIIYERIEAPRDSFARTVDEFRAAGGRGANVTLPFKEEALYYCAELSTRAREAGAVNTLVLDRNAPYGDNTDGAGLLRDLTVNLGRTLVGRRVLLIGAGGAARGVAGPLIAAGIGSLVIVNRTPARARVLASRFAASAISVRGFDELAGEAFDLVVNATSVGLGGTLPALPAGLFRPNALAYEMMYGRETPFLTYARGAGVEVCDGSGMLVEQAAESFYLWRGVRPPTVAVLAALRAN